MKHIMKHTVYVMMMALLGSLGIAEETSTEDPLLYSQDFSTAGEENYKLGSGSKVQNGKLVSDRGTFELFFTADTPVKLSFKVREVEILPGPDHHWGFHLTGGDGYTNHVYTRGTRGVIAALTRNGGKVRTDMGGKQVIVSRGEEAPWSTVDVFVGKKSFGVSIDGQSCIVQDVTLLPIKKLTFYGYRVKFEIDDVVGTLLKEKEVKLIDAPVFSASFDNTLDAISADDKIISPIRSVKHRFLPGVSGMGFSASQDSSPIGIKLVPPNKWSLTDDHALVSEEDGLVDILVPDLEDFDFEATFQRLGNVSKPDHHFNFGIAVANKGVAGFHVRDNSWIYGKTSFKAENNVKDNLDAQPIRFHLIRKDGMLTLSLDDKVYDLGEADFGAVNKLSFNGYGVKYRLDDIKVSGGDFTLSEDFAQFPPAADIPSIEYALENPFSDKVGSVSFWVRSNDGKHFDVLNLVDGTNGKGSQRFSASLRGGARFNVKRTDDEKGLYYMRKVAQFPGDWFHVVLTWEESGLARLFVNGLPYPVSFIPGQRCPLFFNADLDGIKKLVLGKSGDFTLDELKIYHRPLSNEEIYNDYRSVMPIDLVMERSIIDGMNSEKITLQAAPGGYYMRPYPVPGMPFVNADITLQLDLFDSEGDILASESKKLTIDKPMDIAMKGIKLPVGNYNLVTTIQADDKTFQRTFEVASFTETIASEVTKAPYKLGKVLFEKPFNDPADINIVTEGITLKGSLNGTDYLEVGSQKRDRIGTIVTFPPNSIGKPVILEIAWPDDKVRNMGLYMYLETNRKQHRDRLQGGIQAGNEYPNGNTIETVRYIFFPAVEHYLFEARTLASDQPAAVSRIRVYDIVGDLPRLDVRSPENMEGRHFGHMDEDQTFTTNLRVDTEFAPEYPRKTIMQNEDLMRYFDYTGQNTMHYPTWRYSYSFNPLEGSAGNGMYPGKAGELSYIFDSFHRHGKQYIAMINFFTLPDMAEKKFIQYDFAGKGMVTQDQFGNDVTVFGKYTIANIAHPEVRRMFINYFRDTVKRYAKNPGFGGIEWWMNYGTWGSLDRGYDDYTVNAFSKATGVEVPEKVTERYEVLTKEPARSKWLAWRSQQVTGFIREMRAMLDEYNPSLKFNVAIRQTPDMYAEKGVDLAAIKKIENVTLVASRDPMSHRWEQYWGKPESTHYEDMYDAEAPMIKDFLIDGSVGAVSAYNKYFESFNDSLMPERFASYFQNADPKQHGRFFLKEPAFAVGVMDALEFVIGGQPLGSLGRDEETREFTQAYCALPAKPFTTVPGLTDPAVVRYLNTPNGTYFYAVNMHHSPVKVKIDFGKTSSLGLGGITYTDLSTDKELSADVIELLPFQLRSFLIPGKKVEVIKAELASVPPETDAFYQKRIADIKSSIELLEINNIDVQAEKVVVAEVEKAFAARQYAETHRLAFSRRMNQVFQMVSDITNIKRRQTLIDQGIYRINCGSTSFYEAPNGMFFFPDQPFNGLYGYVGNYQSVGRDIGEIKGTEMPEIFRTEAYDIDGYKFKVPNGTYTATLYMKCGYSRGFTEGNFMFSVKANGKMALYKYDIFTETKGVYEQTLAVNLEGIQVTDNILSLEFIFHPSATSNANGTSRLVNAIEIKAKKR